MTRRIRRVRWTETNDRELVMMYEQGKSFSYIGRQFRPQRTEKSVGARIYRLRKEDSPLFRGTDKPKPSSGSNQIQDGHYCLVPKQYCQTRAFATLAELNNHILDKGVSLDTVIPVRVLPLIVKVGG